MHKPSKNYLVISESRTSYFLTNDFDLCRKFETLLICPPLGPIYHTNANCCELDIFLERNSASTSCHKLIIKTFKPVFIKTDKGWTYSTSTPIDVTLNCENNLHKPRHTINGIGNIELDKGCSLHSNTFSLPAYSTQTHVKPLSIKPYPFSTPISLSLLGNMNFSRIQLMSASPPVCPWSRSLFLTTLTVCSPCCSERPRGSSHFLIGLQWWCQLQSSSF